MNAPTPAYGEPWKPLQPDLICDNFSHWMADAFNPAIRDRIITCINACVGMADPAAEITAMREAIRDAHKIIQVLYMDALDHHKESWPRANEWMEKHAAFTIQEP
jgi:hypothetical protein